MKVLPKVKREGFHVFIFLKSLRNEEKMLICYFPHLNRKSKLLKFHVFYVDKIFKDIFLTWFWRTDTCLNGNIKLLKFIFSTDKVLHLT